VRWYRAWHVVLSFPLSFPLKYFTGNKHGGLGKDLKAVDSALAELLPVEARHFWASMENIVGDPTLSTNILLLI
jgi:hypothetical protein